MTSEENFTPVDFVGLRIKSDFSHVTYDNFDYVYDLYIGYKNGILPFEGSHSEQPAQVMQILSLLESMTIEMQTKKMKEQSKKSNGMIPKSR